MVPFFTFLLIAFFIETLLQTFQPLWANATAKLTINLIVAEVLGLLLAFGFGYDLMAELGVKMAVPFVGIVLTGLLAGRGSQAAHDLLNMLAGLGGTLKAQAAIKERTSDTMM